MGRPRSATVLELVCEHCGKEFQRAKRGSVPEHPFCSQACYLKSDHHRRSVSKANRLRNETAKETRPCQACGVPVTRYLSSAGRLFYCSNKCRYEDRPKAFGGPRRIPATGYVLVYVGKDQPGATKSGHILEHRKVMQEMLGRPLLASENVHHVNGQRDDNRPENLELWSTSQPKGQRVEDKLRWAREFLAFYESVGVPDAEAGAQAHS